MEDINGVIEQAIDCAFESNKFVLNFYEYLKTIGATKAQVQVFIQSQTAANLSTIVEDLDEYLIGGPDDLHKQLREAYGHIPKPAARKIRNYLYGILEDAWKYEQDKKRGRRKKTQNK
jgi:hypothetical protein